MFLPRVMPHVVLRVVSWGTISAMPVRCRHHRRVHRSMCIKSFMQSSHHPHGGTAMEPVPALLQAIVRGVRIMKTKSDCPPKPACDPHEEWRLALIHAWKNRRGYTRPTDAAYRVFDEDFILDEF